MREHMKTRHTEKQVDVTVKGVKYPIPVDAVSDVVGILGKLSGKSKSDWVLSDHVFEDLHDKYTKVGSVLRGARLREELTQKELANKIGVGQSDIANMEHGRRPIGKAMAKRLAKALHTDYRVFL
jgi:DNA-binding XRE family transcriptional regulator